MIGFGLQPLKLDQMGEGNDGGMGNPLSGTIRSEIGKQLNGWLKREGNTLIQEAITSAFQEQMPALTENFMNGFAEQLPSDEELDQMEMQEAIDAGFDPQSGLFFDQNGQPYDPQTGQILDYDPQTGEVFLPGEEQYDPRQMQQQGMQGQDPAMNAQLYELRRANQMLQTQLDELNGRYEAAETQAEEADREAQIGRLLNSVPFANDKAASQFRQYVNQQVWRLDDGTIVAGERGKPLPLDKFIEAEVQASPHMVQSRPMGGAGTFARPGMRQSAATMDQIKPFQPKEERDAIIKEVVAAYQQGGTPGV